MKRKRKMMSQRQWVVIFAFLHVVALLAEMNKSHLGVYSNRKRSRPFYTLWKKENIPANDW